MSDGHHHGGDMGGGQPGMLPPTAAHHHHHHHHDLPHIADPSGLTPTEYGRRRSGVRPYRPRAGSPGWVARWILRLAVLAFIGYVAFQVFHGAMSTPSP
jgi:hypothetical protein